MVDDWSYFRSSEVLAQTGHVAYNGWATAMMGWQLYSGALMIRLFGDTFTAVRMSTMIFSLITVILLQRTFVRFGATDRNAAIATAVMTLSPMYLELSATFMSDVQGLFTLVLCIYTCLRALQARTDARAIAWLAAASLGNAVLGSCRQVAWLGVLVMVPSALWLLRKRRTVFASGLAFTVIGMAIVAATLRWYGHQPYALSDNRLFHPRVWGGSRIGNQELQAILEAAFLVLPLLAAFLPSPRKAGRAFWAVVAAVVLLQSLIVWKTLHWEHGFFLNAPYIPNWFTKYGHFTTEAPLLPSPPVVLTGPVLVVVNAFFDIALIYTLRALLQPSSPRSTPQDTQLSNRAVATLLVPFAIAYFVLLIPRASDSLIDRYLIPMGFVAAVWITRAWQRNTARPFPAATLVVTAIIALVSIGSTHDFFAGYRAKGQLLTELHQAGVPDTHIDGGWDIDGWTELHQSDHLNEARIRVPADTYKPHVAAQHNVCMFRVHEDLYPHMAPDYALRYQQDAELGPTPFPAATYTRWLGFGRTTSLYVVKCGPDTGTPTAGDKRW